MAKTKTSRVPPTVPDALRGSRVRVSRPPKQAPLPAIFTPGEVLSETYEVRGVLGSGANGQVFDAHDKMLNRRVAVKAAWPTNERLAPLLRKEAQALAVIRHPSIVMVYAMGVHRGTEYFVMEHVLGVTLDAHLRRRAAAGERMPLLEALDVLVSIAEGLSAVHRAGIAHRDVKPANVMLAPGNRVVLMDLGLVQPEFETSAQPKGTPNYMAPEAVLGTIERGAGHLVDVYALGVLAFLLVTGKLPFEGKTSFVVAQQHVETAVPIVTGAPPKLDALVTEMLAKDPLQRPQALEGVSFRLRAIRNMLMSGAAPQSTFSVLVVDDDRDIAKLVKMYVRSAVPTAAIQLATSAKQALEIVRASPPNLIILDIQMPDMNGIELFMVLRAERLAERSTIVAASAAAKPADVELLYSLGVARFLEKGATFRAEVAQVAREVYDNTTVP